MDAVAARQRLEEMLAELTRSIATLEGEHGRDDHQSGPEARSADPGAALSDNDREGAVIEAVKAQREQVVAALGRVDAGAYGR